MMTEWEIQVTVYKDGKEVATADVLADGGFRNAIHQSGSELEDLQRRFPEKFGEDDHE